MSDTFFAGVGGIVSADIAVPEHERELRFYSRVLSTGDRPLWREDLMNNQGMPIIGLGAQTADTEYLPLQWMPHIQVADVASSVSRALELGGRELAHGKNKEGESQWAVLSDPSGAAFGVIPVVPASAMPPVEDTASGFGCIAWVDLTVSDAVSARDFYREVIGWSVQEVGMKDSGDSYADFNMLGANGKPMVGVCHARGLNTGLPQVWLLYLPVGDLAESLRRVQEEGGKIIKEMNGANGEVSYAVIQDPVGVYVALATG